jgi:hypothetical protein
MEFLKKRIVMKASVLPLMIHFFGYLRHKMKEVPGIGINSALTCGMNMM